MEPRFLVTFQVDGDLMQAHNCYFDTEEHAKALYDTLVDSELIWRVSLCEIKAYHF